MADGLRYHSFTDQDQIDEAISKGESYSVTVGSLGRVHFPANQPSLERIEDAGDDSSIDENYEVSSITSSIEDQLKWRGRMQVVLHSHSFQLFIISLIILDILIVLFELLLDVGALGNLVCSGGDFVKQIEFCHFDEQSRSMCAPSPRLILRMQFLYSNQSQVECKCGFRGGLQVCIPRDEDKGVNPALILHCISLFILSIFVFEILLKLVAFRLKFFTHKFEVFDGMIVLISWMLDLASLLQEEAFQAASLLIFLRLWRIIRVINGSVLSSLTRSNAKMNEAREEAKNIIHAFHKAQDKLEAVKGENNGLRKELDELRNSLKPFE